jgi:nitrogen-specific signal transduction histidine kinase
LTLSDGDRLTIGQNMSERKSLQKQLAQAQKMEALGQLAGGVAHDFNNLLTIISACASFVLDEVQDKPSTIEDVKEIQAASQRAAALTRQLLAFSRRQLLRPEIVNVNQAIQDLGKSLNRLIGDDIELAVVPNAANSHVEVDIHQLEQVLLNLVVNARDAIDEHGSITIETNCARIAGNDGIERDYLVISVVDTGTGIPPEIRERIFEPFFTTKAIGKGTGLGLATVLGIVEQSGGYIELDSVVGKGTSFRVFLPSADATTTVAGGALVADRTANTGTIMLVEDEAVLRGIARRVLIAMGYTVIEARHGGDAAILSAKHSGPIDLLVTDVVMPELGGRELAKLLRAQRPGIPVLYISGYTDDELLRKGVMEPGVQLLRKPFMPVDLARAVRELLGRKMNSL